MGICHQDGSSGGFNSDSADNFAARQQANRFNAYRSKSYKQGSAVIRAIYDVEKAQTEEQYLAAAESLVMLGDWMLWNGAQDSAQQAYQEALRELVELEDAQLQIARLFGEPLALPAIEGVNALPSLVTPEEGDILVQFDVSETGRVLNLERLSMKEEISRGGANRLLRRLRATPFRPRFVDMQPVSTEKITYAYKISD